VRTPRDGADWEVARSVVQVADCNLHQIFHHLGRAHFLMEAFALATERQLAERHPLNVLLSPHFHGTLAINGAARDQLLAPGGQLETLLAPTLEDALGFVYRGIASFRLPDSGFEQDLAARGIAASALPVFPYRDDGRLILQAIRSWVDGYLRLYYSTDADVAGDTELRAWVAELASPNGGRLHGLPTRVETVAGLAEILVFVIFSASAQHAALNYSQFDFMGDCANMPSAAYAPPTASLAERLPPWDRCCEGMEFYFQQSRVRDDRLGHYPFRHFADPRVGDVLERFQQQLDHAQGVITARNATRPLPYPYLLPDTLTASIHI
jgi:arachidonate 15-lipoxygenase